MKKTTKGALAAGTAAFMMLGGAGTFAIWTDDADVDAGVIESGRLVLTAGECADWRHEVGPETGNVIDLVVPGDVVSTTCTFTIDALGDNLSAVPVLDDAEFQDGYAGPAGLDLTFTTEYLLDGVPFDAATDRITEGAADQVLTAEITADFAYGTADTADAAGTNGNATQDLVAPLELLGVTLTQSDPATL